MTITRNLFVAFALGVVLAVPHLAFAQYGGQGLGSALSSNPMSHQGKQMPGVDDMTGRAMQETPFKIIKDVKLGLKDADPAVRVSELLKLRNLQDPEVNQILMNSMLFLRSTEPIVKLHLVAALGRIGDAQGAMPVMQYLGEDQDERGRGTA